MKAWGLRNFSPEGFRGSSLGSALCLEGQGGLVSRFIPPSNHIGTLAILTINLLTKSP